jgi:hypothetical protein
MAYTSQFANVEEVQRSVPDCPLGTPGASRDKRACEPCRYNVMAPRQPSVGCTWRTPARVVEQGLKGLRETWPDLLATWEQLQAQQRAGQVVQGAQAEAWVAFTKAWQERLGPGGDGAQRELCATAGRFAEASQRTGAPVYLLR